MSFFQRRIPLLVFLPLLLLASVACEGGTPAAPTQTLTHPAPTPSPTLAPVPSDTPAPASPRALLLAPSGSDTALAASLDQLLRSLAQAAGLEFEVLQALASDDLQAAHVVVAIPPDPGLADLASAASEVQFLAVGIPGMQPGDNLSVIEPGASTPDQMGFLAGYTAAMITEDWRAGVISLEGDPDSIAASQGFDNGMTYFCGLCLSVYPPFPNTGYPIRISLPAGGGSDAWQAALAPLSTWQVETVFVHPAAASDELFSALTDDGMNLIVAEAPQNAWRDHWVATISPADPLAAVTDIWALMLEGKGGNLVTPAIGFSAANPHLFSPGRQRLVETMLVDLRAGFIDPTP